MPCNSSGNISRSTAILRRRPARPQTLPPADESDVQTTPDRTRGHDERVARRRHGSSRVTSRSTQLGHAWSGGDERYPYNDASDPDATALLGAFIREAVQ